MFVTLSATTILRNKSLTLLKAHLIYTRIINSQSKRNESIQNAKFSSIRYEPVKKLFIIILYIDVIVVDVATNSLYEEEGISVVKILTPPIIVGRYIRDIPVFCG